MMRCARIVDMRNAAEARNLNNNYRYFCDDDIKMDHKRVRVVGSGMYSSGSG